LLVDRVLPVVIGKSGAIERVLREKKREKAAKEVESFFLYMVLKEMEKTLPEGSFIPSGVRGGFIYDYMVTEALSREIVNQGSVFGFDRLLFEKGKS
jgi:Rod binding domain-containing protein